MTYLWGAEFYQDARGDSVVIDRLGKIEQQNARAFKLIQNKIVLVRQQALEDAQRTDLIKHAKNDIYVLRVASRSVQFRLPFFAGRRGGQSVLVFTHCEKRELLKPRKYRRMLDEAMEYRDDWTARNH